MVSARRRRPITIDPAAAAGLSTRAEALRRFAAEVSGRVDLDGLFHDVIDESVALFGVDEAALWTYDNSATPLKLAAQRGIAPDVIRIIESCLATQRRPAWRRCANRKSRSCAAT